MEGNASVTNNNWKYGVENQFNSKYGTLTQSELDQINISEPHNINNNVVTHTAQEAYEKVLEVGGASLARDVNDKRIVREVENKNYTFSGSAGSTNGLIDSQKDVGGWPALNSATYPTDSSGDGMPDAWKESMKLSVSANNPNGNELSTAYDNIEVYINSLVKEIVEKQK